MTPSAHERVEARVVSGGPVLASRRARASAMGCEMGRIRPTNVFERAGESRMTPPASGI